jgi:NAD+ kinase
MKIHFLNAQTPKAVAVAEEFSHIENAPKNEADIFVVFGGDGFMLKMMRAHQEYQKPFYGINCGNVGFLMNNFNEIEPNHFTQLLKNASHSTLPILAFQLKTIDNTVVNDYAINEVAFMRQSAMASNISVYIKSTQRIVCRGDGLLLSTPAGSTAYNASAHGPILPLGVHLLTLTPLAVYHPRNWKGAILKDHDDIEFIINDPEHRRVNMTYDNNMIKNIQSLKVKINKERQFTLLFNQNTCLEERILKEQFAT